jgi:hypothetical protein
MKQTRLDPEEYAYPNGGFTRKGKAILRANQHNPITLPYGEVRAIRASIPDTYFSIPARLRTVDRGTVKGYLSLDDNGEYTFTPDANPESCLHCAAGKGCRKGAR